MKHAATAPRLKNAEIRRNGGSEVWGDGGDGGCGVCSGERVNLNMLLQGNTARSDVGVGGGHAKTNEVGVQDCLQNKQKSRRVKHGSKIQTQGRVWRRPLRK